MTRTTTTSPPDANGMIEIESRELHGDIWIRLKFHWLAKDVGSPKYNDALGAHHRSMDYLMTIPAAEIARSSPWAIEKPKPVETPPVSKIVEAALAAVAMPIAAPVNVMRDTYRARGIG